MRELQFKEKAKKTSQERVKARIRVPETWDEMTPEQVRFIFRKYEEYACGQISFDQLKISAVYNLIGLSKPSRKALVPSALENIARLTELADFMFRKEESGAMSLTFDSLRNPLPFVYAGLKFMTGPSDACVNLTFGEFRNASMCLNRFFETGEEIHLNECIAYLYRPRSLSANKAGRAVKPVEADGFETDLDRISGIPGWQKTLIMMWFSSVIGFLQSGKLVISGEEVDMSALFAKDGDGSGPAATWNDVLMQLAKDGSMGDVDAVDAQPLMIVILNMWVNYKEAKRYEKSSKAKKS